MQTQFEDEIRAHYRGEAARHGTSGLATTADSVVRDKETALIRNFLRLAARKRRNLSVLDIGCGNGYTLALLASDAPQHRYFGIDFTPEMIGIARQRGVPRCTFAAGNCRDMEAPDGAYDLVYSQRCLINILDWQGQQDALREIHRVLKPGGYYLMLESFSDGLKNLNKAREESGLTPHAERHHNLYFDKDATFAFLGRLFERIAPERLDRREGAALLPYNFLSSHYFVARVLHPLVTKGPQVPDTEFVKFFACLPPSGNYSQAQAFIFRKPARNKRATRRRR